MMRTAGMIVLITVLAPGRTGADPSIERAESFLAGLREEQRSKAVLRFEDEGRERWTFTPGPRPGISMKELDPGQESLAQALLKSALSEAGFQKAEAIRSQLESVLREMERNPGRDPELYYIAFFGKPSESGKWSWRWEGHHVSLTFTYLDGRIASTTPQFLGSNPAELREGPHKGLRVLAKEEDLGRELVKSLSTEQLAEARISELAPADILTSNLRKVSMLEDKGIAYGRLSKEQQGRLMDLLRAFAEVQTADRAKERLAKIEKAGFEKLKFAWMGSLEPGRGHYYRIQGPSFVIEYDNTQNGANHIHTVWRDFEGDFGRDALAEHYRTSEHHRVPLEPPLPQANIQRGLSRQPHSTAP